MTEIRNADVGEPLRRVEIVPAEQPIEVPIEVPEPAGT